MDTSQPNREMDDGSVWWKETFAGFVATIPMTLFMLATQRLLPKGQRYELPPELITRELAHRARLQIHWKKKQILAGTLLSHFAYGAAVGALYRPLEKKEWLPAPIKGTFFGLLVWLISYFGLLPLLGLSASAQREPLRRNLMMVVAHALWGSTLATVAAAFSVTANQGGRGSKKQRGASPAKEQ
jgi:uncharacterized membrane protein YagU involved in acid resistance